MAEKNGFAKFIDNLVDKKESENDVMNMLPKPDSQEIGDGIIVWRWTLEFCVIESFLVTRNSNQVNLKKDTYVVNIRFPESEAYTYSLIDETAKDIGSALLSAWNWQHIWKMHAGDFLLDILSQEPVAEPEPFVPDNEAEVVDAVIEETVDQ